jgi:hypothetical protein
MHHSAFDPLADMCGRLQAFDTIFSERSDLLVSADSLRDTAHRTLAVEALKHAISAYTRGVADQQPVDEYVTFALATCPAVKQHSAWRILTSVQDSDDRSVRRDLPLIMRERKRALQYSLNWRKWRWAGVY